MNSKITISVIIPVYNLENEISRTIESVCSQSYKNLQIIVVNDGSNDNSLDICRKYKENDNRITIINKENAGLPMARKSGIEIATGDYIHHLDGGDYIEPHTYETLIAEITQSNYPDMIVFPFNYIYGNRKEVSAQYPRNISTPKEMLAHIWTTQQYNSVWQYIHKKELASEIKFNKSLTLCEDLYYTSQLLMSVKNIKIINDRLLNYVIDDKSMTHMPLTDKNVSSLKLAFELVKIEADRNKDFASMKFEMSALKLQILSTIILGGRLEDMENMVSEFYSEFKIFPELKNTGVIKRVYKLINAYKSNKILYRIILWNYKRKHKIRSV